MKKEKGEIIYRYDLKDATKNDLLKAIDYIEIIKKVLVEEYEDRTTTIIKK